MALNPVIAAIIFRNTLCMDKVTDHFRQTGQIRESGLMPHVPPLGWKQVRPTGDFDWHSDAAKRRIARSLHLGSSRERSA